MGFPGGGCVGMGCGGGGGMGGHGKGECDEAQDPGTRAQAGVPTLRTLYNEILSSPGIGGPISMFDSEPKSGFQLALPM